MNNATQLVSIGNIQDFANLTAIAACSDFIQVTVTDLDGRSRVYAREHRNLPRGFRSEELAGATIREIETAAALISTPAFLCWLVDCGFSLTN